jgi:hypothetical protein
LNTTEENIKFKVFITLTFRNVWIQSAHGIEIISSLDILLIFKEEMYYANFAFGCLELELKHKELRQSYSCA